MLRWAKRSRVRDPLERLRSVSRRAGITRVADIGALDSSGVEVWQSVRPEAEAHDDTFTVFSGKGMTSAECQVGAIAESIERFCAEREAFDSSSIVVSSYAQAAAAQRVVHPARFNLTVESAFDETEPLEWVPAVDLLTGEPHLVPACTVFYPYSPPSGTSPLAVLHHGPRGRQHTCGGPRPRLGRSRRARRRGA